MSIDFLGRSRPLSAAYTASPCTLREHRPSFPSQPPGQHRGR